MDLQTERIAFKEGKMRALTIEVEDRCGNKEVYRQKFIY